MNYACLGNFFRGNINFFQLPTVVTVMHMVTMTLLHTYNSFTHDMSTMSYMCTKTSNQDCHRYGDKETAIIT